MTQCFGCFGADTHPRACAPAPADETKSRSFRHRSQVSDVTHLLGPAEDQKRAKQKSRIIPAIQAPQFGEHAYERIGDVGTAQNAEDVQLMRHRRSKELVTVKYVKQNADALLDKNVEREILNHRRLMHPNILGFREVFATDTHLCIVVEHSAGSLADRCGGQRMAEPRARRLFAQLLDGLAYCHAQGVFHRDLRAEHVLLSGSVYDPVVKIGGFGYSKSAYMDSMAKTMVGMRGYMAPEVFMSSGGYDAAKTDVWAVGVILYQMLTGRLPFCHDSAASGVLDRAMMQRNMQGQFYLPGDLELSMEAQDVLCRVFRPDPVKRISLAQLRRHPWLTGVASELHPVCGACQDNILVVQQIIDCTCGTFCGGPAPADAGGHKRGVGPAVEGRPLQTEEGISEVIHRARRRRLQRERIDPTGSEDTPRPLKDVAQSTPRPGMLSRHSMHHGL